MKIVGNALQTFDHTVKHFRVLHIPFQVDRYPLRVLNTQYITDIDELCLSECK